MGAILNWTASPGSSIFVTFTIRFSKSRKFIFMGKLFIYLFGIVVFFGSCEDKKKATDPDSYGDENEIENEIEIDTSTTLSNRVDVISETEKTIDYPKITNENVDS